MTDFERLQQLALKWSEPFNEGVDVNKTIGEWRRELANLLTENMFYVASRVDGQTSEG